MATRPPDPPGPRYPAIQYPEIEPDSIDRVLDRADALLARNRAAAPRRAAEQPPTDFPVLTEVVPGTPKPPTTQDLMLDQIENELRLELLGQMGPELERLVEARVHERLESSIVEVMSRTRDHLVSEVRRAVREALAQVIGEEIKRLRREPDAK
jgi:hypothetical protein